MLQKNVPAQENAKTVGIKKLFLNNVQVNSFKKLFEQYNVKSSLEEFTLVGFRFTHSNIRQVCRIKILILTF
jgi:hypothetical protein